MVLKDTCHKIYYLKAIFAWAYSGYTLGMDKLDLDKIALLKLAFKGLVPDELEEMAALSELRSYPPGHVLCREGVYEEIFYIIASGTATISKRIGEQDGERVLRQVERGDLVGEMALIQNAPRSATVRTLTECQVLEMDKSHFETMLSRSPRMALEIIRTTLDRLRDNDQMMINDLQKANKVLRQLDRNKTEFIDVVAHELRTPLTVLKGYTNLLHAAPEVKDQPMLASIADGIQNGADRIHAIVNTILDVTRIDVDAVQMRMSPVMIKPLIQETLSGLAKAASTRTIELVHEPEADLPLIHGDPALVSKALYQLVVNAIKFTPDGGTVTISTRTENMEDGTPGVLISVRDTGIGLNAEHFDLVFEKFYQVGEVAIHSSGATSFKGGGPGLGLAIVRGVALAHHGNAWVESPGADETRLPGSVFHLHLPVKV